MRELTHKEVKQKACDACLESKGGSGNQFWKCPYEKCPYDDFDQSVHYKLRIERKRYEV